MNKKELKNKTKALVKQEKELKKQKQKEQKLREAEAIAALKVELSSMEKEIVTLKKQDPHACKLLKVEANALKKKIKALQKKGLGMKAKRRIGNTVIYVILIAMTLIWLAPFFGIVLESFKVETTAHKYAEKNSLKFKEI